MTSDSHCIHSFIKWTRTINLLLSIAVVIISLYIYNCNSLPVSLLIEEAQSRFGSNGRSAVAVMDDTPSTLLSAASRKTQLVLDMIYSRKLIASLVAAQASVFCPLLLMVARGRKIAKTKIIDDAALTLNSSCSIQRPDHLYYTHLESWETTTTTKYSFWRNVPEQTCQFLMPLGLVVCWILSILYDRKTDQLLMTRISNSTHGTASFVQHEIISNIDDYDGFGSRRSMDSILYGLKYSIIATLVFEMWTVWFSTGRYLISTWLKNIECRTNQGTIQLPEDVEGGNKY